MSVAVCMTSIHPTPFPSEKGAAALLSEPSWSDPNQTAVQEDQDRPTQLDIWSSIQSHKAAAADLPPPYVHPLVRRLSSLLSQKSLEVCTESLGSETGSDEFSGADYYPPTSQPVEADGKAPPLGGRAEVVVVKVSVASAEREAGQAAVNYHCPAGRRSPPRSFPPPLPSLSQRDKPCLQMRPRRSDGRLVVEAVPVPSYNFLHSRRSPGRLLLSFVDDPKQDEEEELQQQLVEKGESFYEEEEEVEVVDRGAVVEVKISTQPPQQGSAASKVHRSAFVINKFVGGEPLYGPEDDHAATALAAVPPRRALPATTTTTAAAAVVAASTRRASSPSSAEGQPAAAEEAENKLLFTSKGRSKEELLRHMRRCSQLRRPLFIWEPYCIATSS